MIQIVYKDGSKARFVNGIINNKKEIEWQKELEKNEIYKIPKFINGKWIMCDPNIKEKKYKKEIKINKNNDTENIFITSIMNIKQKINSLKEK